MSQTKKKLPNSVKAEWNLRKILVASLKIIGGVIILGILYIVLIDYVRYKRAQVSQKQKFANALAVCQKEPVVIVKNVTELFGGQISHIAYLPSSKSYNTLKTIVYNPFGLLGYASVDNYYCSLSEAKDAFVKNPSHQGETLYINPVQ